MVIAISLTLSGCISRWKSKTRLGLGRSGVPHEKKLVMAVRSSRDLFEALLQASVSKLKEGHPQHLSWILIVHSLCYVLHLFIRKV